MRYKPPGEQGSQIKVEARFDNFIGGKWVPPASGRYFEDIAPITGQPFTQVARSDAQDVELALDAAHAAAEGWSRTSPAERSALLLKIADRIEANLETLAVAECWENG